MESKSTYTDRHRAFYNKHREEIKVSRKPADAAFYEKNKERIKARSLAYYYAKKAAAASQPEYKPADSQ